MKTKTTTTTIVSLTSGERFTSRSTRTLKAERETVSPSDTLVRSLFNTPVSVVLPPILDQQSHGGAQGVLGGRKVVVQAVGNGAVNVLDSHQLLVAAVNAGESKSFTAEGNEAGNRWNVE
jgi:hypothetical protein